MIDVAASASNYADHILPIFHKLPKEMQGEIRLGSQAHQPAARGRVVLVASWRDMDPLRAYDTKTIYIEHGSGQSYGGDKASAHFADYSGPIGQKRHQGCIGYICPNAAVAQRWDHEHTAVVGSPRLDAYINDWHPPAERTFCLNFHWPCKIAPEAGTAFAHYEDRLTSIVDEFTGRQGWTGFFHVHPRWGGALDSTLAATGLIELPGAILVPEVVICDNSSTMFEAAALGRKVIALNAPWFRRDVDHGLRFWDAMDDEIMVDGPDELASTNLDQYASDSYVALACRNMAQAAYKYIDGQSAQRAADAIVRWVS